MKNEPVYMHYSSVEDQSLHPGVEKATLWTPFTRGQRGQWREKLSAKMTAMGDRDWKGYWYGVPYEDAKEVLRRETSKNDSERQSVQGLLLDMHDPLPDDILEVVDQYYATLRDAMGQKGWTGLDILEKFDVIPWSPFDIVEDAQNEVERGGEDFVVDSSTHRDARVEMDEEEFFGEDPASGNADDSNPPSTPQRSLRESEVDEGETFTTPRRRYETPPTGQGKML